MTNENESNMNGVKRENGETIRSSRDDALRNGHNNVLGNGHDDMQQSAEEMRVAQDRDFFDKLEGNVREMNDEVRSGAEIEEKLEKRAEGKRAEAQGISHEQAKQMMAAEKARIEHEMRKTSSKSRRVLIVVLVTAVVLCIAGVGLALALSGKKADEPAKKDDAAGVVEEKPSEGEDKEEVVELALDNALVQRLYHNFDMVGQPYTGTMDFYTDEGVASGELSKELMLAIALRAAREDGCRGALDYMDADQLYSNNSGCYSADTMRLKLREMFGRDVEFVDGDWAGKVSCSWQYSAKNEEFYQPAAGCGGTCFMTLSRELEKAEHVGDEIYLYEQVYGENCNALYTVNGDVVAEREYGDRGVVIKDYDINDYVDQLEHFKWTFRKTADGDYAFAGLEKV